MRTLPTIWVHMWSVVSVGSHARHGSSGQASRAAAAALDRGSVPGAAVPFIGLVWRSACRGRRLLHGGERWRRLVRLGEWRACCRGLDLDDICAERAEDAK